MSKLPAEFSDLDALADVWALPTEDERSKVRWASNKDGFQALYDALLDRIEDIMAHLDQYEIGHMPDDARTLYYLALAFAEASPHVEMYKGSPVVPNSFDAERFVATHGSVPD